jgi:succinyl-CoA synthetase beta subunit
LPSAFAEPAGPALSHLNIHEYQGRELFEKFGVATASGGMAATPQEAIAIARGLGSTKIVVKAQVHAGGRGKGAFTNGLKGGVQVAASPEDAGKIAERMLGQTLVTHQTGPAGRKVSKVLVVGAIEIARELYFAILLDRATSSPVVIASTEGGMDIEAVAAKSPDKIIREPIHPLLGLQSFQSRKLAHALGLAGAQIAQAAKLFGALYKLFVARDCTLIEVNPLVVTRAGEIMALDAKFNFDDNALYRQPDIVAMRDVAEEDPREVAASAHALNYIGLDGNIACLVNGAGLAMATMDIIQHYGGRPANFLDVGGGASKEQVAAAFAIILSDPNVQGILVNIFGGIMDCNVIANGIVAAARETRLNIPLVVRLEGNNVAAGKQTLAESGLAMTTANDLGDAAEKIVAAVQKR